MKRIYLFLPATLMFLVNVLAFADSPGPILNPDRAYPPSCLGIPLPAVSGPTTTARVTLETVDTSFHVVGTEQVNFVFWRSPCNNGRSALLGTIARDSALQNTYPAPVFGGIDASQGSIQNHAMRLVAEPNTTLSYLPVNQIILSSLSFVFENDVDAIFDFNMSLTLTVFGLPNLNGTIPAYNSSQYANASLAMQISGYQSGNFSDPTGAQGIQIEVVETSTLGQRALVLAWYTYDSSGTPYWLFNSTTFNVGARSVSFPLGYFAGGGFAGGPGNASASVWGNVSVSFPDCNHMTFSYQSLSGLPAGVPVGSGTRIFTRVTSINGVTCDSP